jgi:small GTP-binding protein
MHKIASKQISELPIIMLPSCTYKFIVIGPSGVGKTLLLRRLIGDQFSGESSPTIGVEQVTAVIGVDGQSITLQIWDTAGQEKFRSIAKSYFRNAVGVILVFDLTDHRSFEELGEWLSDAHQYCEPNAVITLIGNKTDLVEQRSVTPAEAQTFATMHQMAYLEACALSGDNVAEAFRRATKSVHDRARSGMIVVKAVALDAAPPQRGCC